MAETPDFEKIARNLADVVTGGEAEKGDVELVTIALVACWNARGAADIAKIESDLSAMMGTNMAGPYVKNLDRALRSLDR